MLEELQVYEWHYVGQYGPLGPLSEDQMLELVDSGVITRDTYVWKAGMSDWRHAGDIPTLGTKLPPPLPPPVPQASPETYTGHLTNTYRQHPPRYENIISPCSRVLAGALQLIPGVGRMYLGYMGIGIIQLVVTICSGGLLYIWPFIDGILILAGNVKVDGYGRMLKE